MDFFTGIVFQTIVILSGTLVTSACALLYFQRVRLERPPLGVFNPRDIGMLLFFIFALPLLYLILPSYVLTGFLVLTFVSALYLALRPFMLARYLWPLILLLMVANILVTEMMLGTRQGWQLYWVLTDAVVLVAAVGVSNLYVQGGMRLRHIAWFALFLAFYDGFFAYVVPISVKLADRFEGQPLDPSIGFSIGPYNGNIGLGDLLVFSLFMVAAYKGFGRRGVISAFVIITIGGIMTGLAPLVITASIRQNVGIVVPAQVFFGPMAFITYFWLARYATERSMGQWMSEQDAAGHEPIRVTRRTRSRPVAAGRSVQPVADIEVGVKQAG